MKKGDLIKVLTWENVIHNPHIGQEKEIVICKLERIDGIDYVSDRYGYRYPVEGSIFRDANGILCATSVLRPSSQ